MIDAQAAHGLRLDQPNSAKAGGGFRALISASNTAPKAVLCRQVATPNYELRSFLRACRRRGLYPVIQTYHNDRVTHRNPFKRSLVTPMFIEGINRLAEPIWRGRQIINVETVEKHRLRDVMVDEWSLPDLHLALLRQALPDEHYEVVDGSEWFAHFANGARDYYLEIFLALTGGTVLFETFVTSGEEGLFYNRVVRPAFDEATHILGHEPAIKPLCAGKHAASPLWYAYPESYRTHFAALGVVL